MASPSLKITLKLSGPKRPSESPQSVSPASKDEQTPTEMPRKRAKPNPNSRQRKPKTEGTPTPDTPMAVDEEGTDDVSTPNVNKRTINTNPGGQNNATTLISRKELLKHKDIKVRKWEAKPLVFYTLNGSAITVSSWQSDQKMQLNERTTEPITVAEIDQLFSSTAGEKDFRPFLCTQPGCSKAFTTFDQLQTHETNMHGTKKLVCGIDGCHKSFVTPGQLTKHRKMVHFRAARKAKLAAEAEAAKAKEDDDSVVDVGQS
ncbi:uncharacterized protein B0P05DRAFT_522925 [Gilbertella persicaria]|uniref:uncharacterized protein n=1 Tax=Gilbertella persicaria TaxID=101096 RepID=UPI00222081A7|nr:uncharacterized protein B0P05DRAFT_522925 [Gilbertella persicaria]KAI8098002.1 hypothetical protein B0P05DRAFT_522925 [Gilbertella persicaria]